MLSDKIRVKSRMLEAIQDLIEANNLGVRIARQKLGKTPKSIVVKKISSLNKVGRSGVLLIKVKFNSTDGPFEGSIVLKDFKSEEEVNRLVSLNNWLINRVQDPRVLVPQIFSAGGTSIIYEGIEGDSYEESKLNNEIKLKLAGYALCTYHLANTSPINEIRYKTLLKNLVAGLPISNERKIKLSSFGTAFLTYYQKSQGGIISYGDFHPGNIMISPMGDKSYLIDPEFIESESGADRFEDIGNFFVFDAYMELLNKERLTETFSKLKIFLEAYDKKLQQNNTSLNSIYQGTQYLALIFHLGLTALMKGTVAYKSMKTMDSEDVIESTDNSRIEEIIQSYRLCREIWFLGVQYLPKNAIPRMLRQDPIKDDILITWRLLYKVVMGLLKRDDLLGLLFKFPPKVEEISLEAAINLYKVNDRKELQNKIRDLSNILNFNPFDITKMNVKLKSDWVSRLGVPVIVTNWHEAANQLFRIWRKNPINMLIAIISSFSSITIKELENGGVFDKNKLKKILKRAERKTIISFSKEKITLNRQWRLLLGVPNYFDLKYFS